MPFKDHPAIAAAVLSAALIAARLLSVARFDVSTAATILQLSGTGTAVAGTALTLLPFALVLATCLLAVVVFIDNTLIDVSLTWARLLLSLAVGATLCMTAAVLAIGTLGLVLGVAVLGRYVRRKSPSPRVVDVIASSRLLRIQATALFVVVALAPIVLQRPWLPIQSVAMTDGSLTVGYVLGEAQGRLALMSDADRTIKFIEPDEILEQSICSGRPSVSGAARQLPQLEFRGSFLGAILWSGNTPRYPPCPGH